jgi:hypothetical protein
MPFPAHHHPCSLALARPPPSSSIIIVVPVLPFSGPSSTRAPDGSLRPSTSARGSGVAEDVEALKQRVEG